MKITEFFLAAAAIFSLSASMADAQKYDLMCPEALDRYNVGQPETEDTQSLISSAITFEIPEELANSENNDPIALAEKIGAGNKPVIFEERFEIDGKYLYCALILVEFRVGERATAAPPVPGTPISKDDGTVARYWALLVKYPSKSDTSDTLEWEESGYRMSVKFPNLIDQKVLLSSVVFKWIPLFDGNWSGSDQHVRVVRDADLGIPEHETTYPNDAIQDDLLVLCGGAGCAATVQSITGAREKDSETITAEQGTSTAQQGTSVVAETTASAESTGVGTTPSLTAPNEPETSYHTFTVHVTGQQAPDVLVKKGIDTLENLACLIHSISEDVFAQAPQCSGVFNDFLNKRDDLRLQVTPEGRWHIVDGITSPTPQSIIVSLPEGVIGSSCVLTLSYLSADGSTLTKPMNPDTDQTGTFLSAVAELLPDENGDVTFDISVSSPAQCGGDTRTMTVPAARIIDVNLSEEVPSSHSVLYAFIPDASTIKRELNFTQQLSETFSNSLVDATLSAHQRLATLGEDQIINLSRALGVRLSLEENSTVFSFDSDTMRGPFSRANLSSEEQIEITRLAKNGFPLRSSELISNLNAILNTASNNSRDTVDIVILGTVLPNATSQVPNPCLTPELSELATETQTPNGQKQRIFAFPIVKLKDRQVPDPNSVSQLSFTPGSPGLGGGLHRCMNLAQDTNIFPFFIEPWRPADDAIIRYRAALTDQLYTFLEEFKQ